jgi:acyl-CoA synthetase (NDP forming)
MDGREARTASLDAMFRAQSVGVIGASSDAAKIGGKPVALMKEHFRGTVVPINPNRSEIAGLACAPSIGAAGAAPDLAVVAVSASMAEGAIADCLAVGVKAIALFTAGFGEIDAAGLAAQERIAAACASKGVRLLGPNSLGFIGFHEGLYATFSSALDNVWPKPGSVGIASQSGAVGTYIMALAAEAGLGFSHFIATGNEADVDVADCIAWLAADPATTVIVAYLEGCRDGRRLARALAVASQARKPVIAIKPGATEAGLAAVKSHTGMLAGSKQVFDAVLKAHGAWPATSIEEAVDIAYAAAQGKFPQGPEAVIITPSGGVGIMLTDAAAEAGLVLPPISSAAQAAIKEVVPLASTGNPVDTTAQVANDFRLFGKVIDIAADQTDCPTLVVFMAHMGKTPAVTDLLRPTLTAVAERSTDRIVALVTRASPEFRAEMAALGYLVFEDPTRAVRAIGALRRFAQHFARAAEPAVTIDAVDCDLLREAASDAAAAGRLVAGLGLSILPVLAVADEEAAARAAGEVGYPVVLKIDSPDIQHKTEVGGVHLDIADEGALWRAWATMMASVRDRARQARVAGATVSPMLKGGVETIIGTQNDPDFGPVVMFGLGGVMTEALKDVVFAPAPISLAAAHRMIDGLRASVVLAGWRGAAPADREALARAIATLAALAAAHADVIESIEINPFVALPQSGAALDVLVVLRKPALDPEGAGSP